MISKAHLGAICACLIVTSHSSHAIPVDWINNTGGTFNDPTNWSSDPLLPGVGDFAVFDLGSVYNVNFIAAPSNNLKLLIRNDNVSFDLGGYTYTLTSTVFPQASLTVGELNGDIGQLTIMNGTIANYHTLLGDQAGSNGTLNISTGATLTSASVIRVGENGDGTLNILNGGTASNTGNSILGFQTGSTGSATVSGTGSSWNSAEQYIGYQSGTTGNLSVENEGSVTVNGTQYFGYQSGASGDMTIQSGGSVAVNGAGFIGYAQNSTSEVMVDGTGSSYSATSELRIGDSGTGNLTVSNGATISNAFRAIIGTGSSATGTVNIDGSTWSNTGDLNVGWTGDGALNISNGGTVSNTHGSIARYAGSTGIVNVDGAGSTWTNTFDLYLGGSALGGSGGSNNGFLNITNGGVVSSRNGIVAHYSGSTGTVTVDGVGSQWNNTGDVQIGNTGQGSLLVSAGGSVTSTRGYVGLYNTPSQSTATITGAVSNWTTSDFLEVRYGSLNINNGGSVTTQNYGNISSSLGVANVDGAGSSWDMTTYLTNYGTLNITNGGSVSTGTQVTLNSNSSTTVDGANALLESSTYIDTVNSATLDILNGGTASATDSWIRVNGVVSVAGADATLNNSGSIYVGGYNLGANSGTGVLNINLGGIVNAGDTLKIWNPGIVNMNGGTLNVNTLDIGGGAFNFTAGTLNFTADFILGGAGPLGSSYSLNGLQSLGVAGTATIAPASVLTLDGGTFSAGMLTNNGTFQFNSGTFNLTNSNMTIGAGGLFGSNVQLSSAQTVNVSNATTINSGSVLTLNNGSFSSGSTTNNGDIVLNGASSRLGGALINNSILKGTGRVDAQVTNNNGAQIRVAGGESMRFTSAGNTNAGRIEVIGGEVEFDQNLVNQSSTGNIVARDATLRFNGGLDNQGGMGLSFGTTDVFGDINNTGSVVISGSSNATFYDDYINNGVTQTSAGSNAVFFGSVTGAGSYTGTGTLFFEGDLAPGNSPALVTVGGDMNLGVGLTTIMELAGTLQGDEYDAFDIAGDLSLGGILGIDLLGIFSPANGDHFDLFMAENIYGDFTSLLFPELTGGLLWDLTLYEDFSGSTDVLRLSVSQIPIPAAVWLFGSGLIGLIGIARRKQSKL